MKLNLSKIGLITAIFLFLDQLTKWAASSYLKNPLEIIKNIFGLKYTENTGVAFSIPIPFWAIIILNIALLSALAIFMIKDLKISNKMTITAISLIFAGGIGNLFDRIFLSHVIDFIQIWKWPTFNLADMYIVVGILMIIGFYGKLKKA